MDTVYAFEHPTCYTFRNDGKYFILYMYKDFLICSFDLQYDLEAVKLPPNTQSAILEQFKDRFWKTSDPSVKNSILELLKRRPPKIITSPPRRAL